VKSLEWRHRLRNENNILVQRNVKGKCVSKTLTVSQTMVQWPFFLGGGGGAGGNSSNFQFKKVAKMHILASPCMTVFM
jgi:hypothetical protein